MTVRHSKEVAVSAMLIVALAGLLWLLGPKLLYPNIAQKTLSSLSLTARLSTANDRAKLQSDARTGIAQALGGLLLLGGAFTAWRQYRSDVEDRQQQREHDRTALQADRDARRKQREHDRAALRSQQLGQAVEFLASGASDVRLAAALWLSRVAEESRRDRALVGQILSAFIRNRCPWPPVPPRPSYDMPTDALQELRTYSPDVQGAIEVLGRHNYLWYGKDHFRFRYADLRRVNLSNLHFEKAAFTEAHMERAWLRGSKCRHASFRDALLTEADLSGADLRDTNLRGADLTGANLTGTLLAGAHFDATTAWPDGFDEFTALDERAVKVEASAPPTSSDPTELVAE
jgi:hypothetical protein